MKKHRKMAAVLAMLVTAFSVVSCGGGSGTGSSTAQTSGSGTTEAAQAEETTQGTTEAAQAEETTQETPAAEDSGEATAAADYSYSLNIGTALSPTHGQMVGFWDPWMEAVTNKTGGNVTFTVYSAGELIESGQEYDGLQENIIDIAAPISFTYDPTNFPASDFCMLPLKSSTASIGAEAWKAMLQDEGTQFDGQTFNEYMFGNKNLFVLPVNVAAEACICTSGAELNTVDDFNGLKIRTGSAVHTMLIENLGMESVSMTVYDAYDAMSRGAVDGAIHFIADWASYGLEDIYRYCVDGLAFGGHFCSVAAWNLDTWNEFPEELQNIMIESAYEVIPDGAKMFEDWREQAIADYSAEYGTKFVEFSELSPEVQDKFNEAMTETWKQWIERYDAEGYRATEMAKLWMECIEAAGGEVPDGVHELFE
ncbi:MAG: hypothetical protein IJP92_17015 [Lachnospiraceae bacterium]|nr:hypothetical protein [Lachnospiraceae bacterium]